MVPLEHLAPYPVHIQNRIDARIYKTLLSDICRFFEAADLRASKY